MLATSTREEINVGGLVIRFLVEGEQSAGSVAVFEFDVPAGAKVGLTAVEALRLRVRPELQ